MFINTSLIHNYAVGHNFTATYITHNILNELDHTQENIPGKTEVCLTILG